MKKVRVLQDLTVDGSCYNPGQVVEKPGPELLKAAAPGFKHWLTGKQPAEFVEDDKPRRSHHDELGKGALRPPAKNDSGTAPEAAPTESSATGEASAAAPEGDKQ